MILLELFASFLLIGIMTYGGGYSVLPLVDDLIVQRHGWLSAAEVADIVSISEMSPGPFSLNCSSFVGMKVAGIPGAVLATAGFLLPPLAVVLILAFFYSRYRSLPAVRKVFSVLNACIIAVLLGSVINLLSSSVFGGSLFGGSVDLLALIIFLASFLGLFKFKLNPVVMLIASALVGAVFYPILNI